MCNFMCVLTDNSCLFDFSVSLNFVVSVIQLLQQCKPSLKYSHSISHYVSYD